MSDTVTPTDTHEPVYNAEDTCILYEGEEYGAQWSTAMFPGGRMPALNLAPDEVPRRVLDGFVYGECVFRRSEPEEEAGPDAHIERMLRLDATQHRTSVSTRSIPPEIEDEIVRLSATLRPRGIVAVLLKEHGFETSHGAVDRVIRRRKQEARLTALDKELREDFQSARVDYRETAELMLDLQHELVERKEDKSARDELVPTLRTCHRTVALLERQLRDARRELFRGFGRPPPSSPPGAVEGNTARGGATSGTATSLGATPVSEEPAVQVPRSVNPEVRQEGNVVYVKVPGPPALPPEDPPPAPRPNDGRDEEWKAFRGIRGGFGGPFGSWHGVVVLLVMGALLAGVGREAISSLYGLHALWGAVLADPMAPALDGGPACAAGVCTSRPRTGLEQQMAFFQDPPRLGNQFDDDMFLQDYLARVVPADVRAAIEPELRHLGELSGGPLYEMQLQDRLNEPVLTQWDSWGRRVDHVEVTPLWKEAAKLAAEHGFVAAGYEQKHGAYSRIHQFALNYVTQPSLDIYSCPLAMTDGAARTILDTGNKEIIDRAIPRLTSRDPSKAWTSGQWMTERTGGSDVGLTETEARQSPEGWRLYGTKWFTSAVTSQMSLTLGRPQGNGPGGRGLALFYVEVRDAEGRLNGIQVNRLKDKLGTRKVPTAELTLDGTLATPVAGLTDGIRNISSMLNITRTWNAIGATMGMRRALALARDFAQRRVQFGAKLADKPLHVDTLAGMEAEFAGSFLLTFSAIELLGRIETGAATETDRVLLRFLTPLAKLTTGKQAVAIASEALECFGGAGYVEDTGLPTLLRDAQVLSIWEGTTNVLSLDAIRALAKPGTLDVYREHVEAALSKAHAASLAMPIEKTREAVNHASHWLAGASSNPLTLEAGARRFALTLGRSLELALLTAHAQWCLDHERGERAAAAARRLARNGVDLITDMDVGDAKLLA